MYQQASVITPAKVIKYLQQQSFAADYTFTDYIKQDDIPVLSCPQEISATMQKLCTSIAELRLLKFQLGTGSREPLRAEVKQIEEVKYLPNATIDAADEDTIQVYYLGVPGLLDSDSQVLVKGAHYKLWNPQMQKRPESKYRASGFPVFD